MFLFWNILRLIIIFIIFIVRFGNLNVFSDICLTSRLRILIFSLMSIESIINNNYTNMRYIYYLYCNTGTKNLNK